MTDINALSRELYDNARDKGFYEHEGWLRSEVDAARSEYTLPQPIEVALREHFGNRLMLIAGEVTEAHEEVRAGHGIAELYFSLGAYEFELAADPVTGVLRKPEGVLAELADVAIRTLETMQSILDQASYDEMTKLRGQVPESDATDYTVDAIHNRAATQAAEPVNVAEVILLKHRFNLSRAAKHGGKAF